MLIRTEKYKSQDGVVIKKEYFGKDNEHISATVEGECFDYGEYTPEEALDLFDRGIINVETYKLLIGEQLDSSEIVTHEEILAEIMLNQAEILARLNEVK